MFMHILQEISIVAGDMAPYLLFGFGIAGLLHIFTSGSWLKKHLGGAGFMPVLKGVLLGVPLPLCSCGVIGVSASLRKQGASRGAVTGFLISTPQTGVDSILATWGMLGPFLGIFRPLVAFLTGIAGGTLVTFFDKGSQSDSSGGKSSAKDCCNTEAALPRRTLGEVLRYGFITLPRDIAKPLVVGIVVSGMISALLPEGMLAPYIGGGIVAMMVMAVIGIPIYVCATASIPLAVGFIHLGASPGAALAFLIAGPATNAATIATVWKSLGKGATLIYVGSVATGGILAGLLFDLLVRYVPADFSGLVDVQMQHAEGMNWFKLVAALVLFLILLNSLYGHILGRFLSGNSENQPSAGTDRNSIELTISGMTCEHCARTVSSELETLNGVENVQVDFKRGKARIIGNMDGTDILLETVRELGYEARLS